MKKLLSVALALLLVTSTFALTACTEKPSTSSSKSENSQSVALPSPSPIPTELSEEELNIYYGDDKRMDYAEFMAEEREFKDRSSDYQDGYRVHEDFENGRIVKCVPHGFYEPCGEIVQEFIVPYESFQQPIKCENIFYMVVNEKTVVRFDRNFGNLQELFTVDEPITSVRGDRDIIYFSMGEKNKKFYSFHIKSKQFDLMCEMPNISGYGALSNKKVTVFIYTAQALKEIEEYGEVQQHNNGTPAFKRFIYDMETEELTEVVPMW